MHPTVLIGLDGATFTLLDPLMEQGVMPFLKRFISEGSRAGLLSTPNPLTPPAWVSMITGRSPGHHGIFDFIWAQQRETDHYFTLYGFADIKCETIWSMVNRKGGQILSLNFPVMSPPPKVDGYMIPGLVSWKYLRRNVHPREWWDEIKELDGFNPRELAWDFDMEKKAAKGVPREEYEAWVDFHIRRERQWFEVVRHMIRNHPTELTAVLFDGTDKIQHMGWRFLDPQCFPKQPTDWERDMQKRCLGFYRELDRFLEEIVKEAGPDARVFMASDHGFGPSWETLRINTWLCEQGYLTWKDMSALDDKSAESVQRLVDNHFVLLDWDKTTAYARTVTSNGIYIRVAQKLGESGVPASEYHTFRNELIRRLETIVDPDSGERIIKNILLKEETFPGAHSEQAPDLTLVMRDHSFVSIVNKEPVVCRRPEVEGTHYPEGIFIGRGPGIRPGKRLAQHSILDVTPTLLYSLGLETPSDLEGKVATGFFEPPFIEAHPIKTGDETQLSSSEPQEDEVVLSEEDQKEIYQRLRMLGYIE